MQARKPKKGRVILYPRHTLPELIGSSEAAKWTTSQSNQSSQPTIPDNAYSIIRRVLSEVTNMVRSMKDMIQVPRALLNEKLEDLATAAFPDRTNPLQDSSWNQYMRIASEVIGQVMQNFEKVTVEVTYPFYIKLCYLLLYFMWIFSLTYPLINFIQFPPFF